MKKAAETPSQIIRDKCRINDIKHWQLADEMGISEATITRWLRKADKDKETKAKFLEAIESIVCNR